RSGTTGRRCRPTSGPTCRSITTSSCSRSPRKRSAGGRSIPWPFRSARCWNCSAGRSASRTGSRRKSTRVKRCARRWRKSSRAAPIRPVRAARIPGMRRHAVALLCAVLALGGTAARLKAQPAPSRASAPRHRQEVKRLLIRGAMVIPGTGVPASGPMDLLLEGGLIARMGNAAAEKWPAADAESDATGKYAMPGIVNTHMHWHEERVGPLPIQYERNLYLSSGVTTAREVGGNFEKTRQWRAESAAHKIVAPRILLYPMLRDLVAQGHPYDGTPEEIKALVLAAEERGAARLKLSGPMDRDQAAAALRTAGSIQLPTTVHIAVGEATARAFVDLGVECIEHFYAIAEATCDGVQDFPREMNLANEIHRFGRAGELYTQTNLNREKLSALLDDMVAKGVAWSPTMSTYEATRDLVRAQNL